jgi:hypothetical protein
MSQLLGRAATTRKSRDLFYNFNDCFGRTNPWGRVGGEPNKKPSGIDHGDQ